MAATTAVRMLVRANGERLPILVDVATGPVGDLKIAIDRVERLEAENRRLRAENDALLERFVTWAYNANLFGLDVGKLEQQTPPAGRS